jgi:pyruvate/2-oxoacid:ferredoxin oxidoreductase beta subunit
MVKTYDNGKTSLALMAKDLEYIKKDVTEIKLRMEGDYATREWVNAEYGQTRKIVNAIVITMGTAIVGAFATFVIRGGLK